MTDAMSKLPIELQFPTKGTYHWWFRELANKQTRLLEFQGNPSYLSDISNTGRIKRLQQEFDELTHQAGQQLAPDEFQRMGFLLSKMRDI